MSKIISVGTAVPDYCAEQSVILNFMQDAYNDDTASRKLKILFQQSGIKKRYSVVADFKNESVENSIFDKTQQTLNIEKRLSIFKKHAPLLAIKAIDNVLNKINLSIENFKPTHIITVTCTGLYAPGLDAEIIEKLNFSKDIFHISVNFMGCNAAFPALKIADLIAKSDDNAIILVVCVELCTLHFRTKNSNDNILSNTLFGDGAAAAIVVSDTTVNFTQKNSIKIEGFYSLIISSGKDLMGWNITSVNFEMILDAKVPEFIGNEIKELIRKIEQKLHITQNSIGKWAIHPGGKKILDNVQKQLQLTDQDLQYSYKVLSDYGNMSSPTILFVLNEIMQADHIINEKIMSIGFGPGINIETAVFSYC